MKKVLLLGAAFCAVSFTANAADITPYVSAKAAYSFTDGKAGGDSIKVKNPGLDIAAGAKINDIRGEIAFGYLAADDKTIDGDKIEFSANKFMINGYYDIDIKSAVKPYVGLGAGMAKTKYVAKVPEGNMTISKNKFAYSLMAGAGYNVTKELTLDLGYRYTDYGSNTKDFGVERIKVETTGHEVLAGIRYAF